MNPREIARALSIGRIAIGAGLMSAPRVWAPLWVGRGGVNPAARLFSRAVGARDIALGVGTLAAMSRGAPVQGWLRAAVLADATDAIATLVESGDVPRRSRRLVYLIGGGAALAGAAIQASIDETSN